VGLDTPWRQCSMTSETFSPSRLIWRIGRVS